MNISAPPPADGPEARSFTVRINGVSRRVPAGTTLELLVGQLTSARAGVAAALNETVVPRGRWPGTPLGEGDRVEVLTAVQGG